MKYYFLSVGLLFYLCSSSQELIRSSLSSMGSSASKNGIVLKQTIGQSSNTTTLRSSIGTIRQGFQQPINRTAVSQQTKPIQLKVSPNPALESTTLTIDEEIRNYTLTIENLNAGLIYKEPNQSQKKRTIDITSYTPGVYLISVISNNRIGYKKVIIGLTQE